MVSKRLMICVVVGLAAAGVAMATPSVGVNLKVPPPDRLTEDDLYDAVLTTTGGPVEVYLKGYILCKGDTVVRGFSSNTIHLDNGTKRITRDSIAGISNSYVDSGYGQFRIRGGTIPACSYTMCLVVLDSLKQMVLGYRCITQNVGPTGAPVLHTPPDGAKLPKTQMNVVFTWFAPTGAKLPIKYAFKMVEVKNGQSPQVAMNINPAWHKQTVPIALLKYPPNAKPLDDQRTYAWQVSALGKYSGIFTFSFEGGGPPPPPETGVIRIITPSLRRPQKTAKPTFKWDAAKLGKEVTFSIEVRELADTGDMDTGRLVWSRSDLAGTTLRYPAEESALSSRTTSVWSVAAYKGGEVVATSTWDVAFTPPPPPPPPPCLVYRCPAINKICSYRLLAGTLVKLGVFNMSGGPRSWTLTPNFGGGATQTGTVPTGYSQITPATQPPAVPGLYRYTFTPNAPFCGPRTYFVFVYPSAWITDMTGNTITQLCWGQEAKVVSDITSDFDVNWSRWDLPSTVPDPTWGGSGTSQNTTPNTPTCVPFGGFVNRIYHASFVDKNGIMANPWPNWWWGNYCPKERDLPLKVWCPSQAGAIDATSSTHNLHISDNTVTLCSSTDALNPSLPYPVNLTLTLLEHNPSPPAVIKWDNATLGETRTVVINAAGQYDYWVTVTNGTCPTSAPSVIHVIVEDPMSATIKEKDGKVWVCPDKDEGTMQIVSTTPPVLPPGAITQWQWAVDNCDPVTGTWYDAGTGPEQNTNGLGPKNPRYAGATTKICWRLKLYTTNPICDPSYSNIWTFWLIKKPILAAMNPALYQKCPGASVTIQCPTTVGGTGPFTYEWFRNGKGPVFTGCPLVTTDPGKYYCKVWSQNKCSFEKSNVVTVEDCPVLLNLTATSCCSDGHTPITLTATATPSCGHQITMYTWDGPNYHVQGPTMTAITLSPPPSQTSTYTVTVTDDHGCSSSASFTITACH